MCAVLSLAMLPAVPAGRAGAISNGTLALQPAVDPGQPSRSVFSYTLSPGQSLRDAVVLANLAPAPLDYEVYAAGAYNVARGGAFALRSATQPRSGVGAWVHLPAELYRLPPRASETIPFSVSVPAGAAPGDHAGGIVALSLGSVPVQRGGLKVAVREGVGTPIYVRVPGPLRRGARVSDVRARASVPPWAQMGGGTSAAVSLRLRNTGDVRLTGRVAAWATDSFGRVVKRFASMEVSNLLPGSAVVLDEPSWHGLPFLGPRLRVRVRFSAPDVAAAGAAAFWDVPWLALGLIAVLVLLGAVGGRRGLRAVSSRRRRARDPALRG